MAGDLKFLTAATRIRVGRAEAGLEVEDLGGRAAPRLARGTTTSRASEINKFMSLLSMALPIENLSIITFDSWLSRGRG